jgi:tetratricopeptide (TPR) repeat protein
MKQIIYFVILGSVAVAGCAHTGSVTREADARGPAPAGAAATDAGSGANTTPSGSLPKDVLYQLLIGEIAGQRGQLDVSVANLSAAATSTRDAQLAERATLVALYARQIDSALPNARLWVDLQPDNAEAHEALGLCLVETGDAAGAVAEFEQLFKNARGSDATNAAIRIATTVGRAQKRDTALAVMGTLVENHRSRAELHFAQAHLAVRVGDLDLADRASAEALRLRPDWEEAAIFRSRVLVSRKETQQALEFNEAFLAKHRRAVAFRTNHARYLVELKQWERAREQFKRAAQDAPTDADILYAVGLLSMQTGRPDEAEDYLARAVAEKPDNDQARLYLGQLAFDRRDYAKAAGWFSSVDQESELYFESRTRLALVTARKGDLADARAQLAALLPETDAERVQVALAEEQMLREANQYQEALKVLSQYIESMPDNNDLLYARSLVAEHLNDLALHERDLRSVIERDPKNAHALNALGYTLADRTTRYEESRALLEQALELKPDDPYIMDSVGWVYYRLGRHDEAVKYLRAAIAKRPDAEISAHLGEVLWVMGDHATAESVWSQALQAAPDSEVLLGIIKKFKP